MLNVKDIIVQSSTPPVHRDHSVITLTSTKIKTIAKNLDDKKKGIKIRVCAGIPSYKPSSLHLQLIALLIQQLLFYIKRYVLLFYCIFCLLISILQLPLGRHFKRQLLEKIRLPGIKMMRWHQSWMNVNEFIAMLVGMMRVCWREKKLIYMKQHKWRTVLLH